MSNKYELFVNDNDIGIRIDKYISNYLDKHTRSQIQKMIKDGFIYVNNKNIKANYKVRANDYIVINIQTPEVVDIKPEDIPIDVIYEDDDLIIINKAKGVVVHPASGHNSRTLVNGLLYHYKNQLSKINGDMRPGIVHRLDKNTTGVIIVCKNDKSHESIARQLKEKTVTRKYNAIVYNAFSQEQGIIEAPIGRHPVNRKKMAINYDNGKDAITHYKVIENLNHNFSYVECKLETGRTHQIRVHMSSISHPILGDDIYGPSKSRFKLEGQVLHARIIGFEHPSSKKYMEFEATLPDYFIKLINKLSK